MDIKAADVRPRPQAFVQPPVKPEEQELARKREEQASLEAELAERELRSALAELPERMRTVLALRYFDNMEYQTIASTLGLSLGNVKTLIHRGKIALTKKMREHEAAAAKALPCAAAKGGTRALLLV